MQLRTLTCFLLVLILACCVHSLSQEQLSKWRQKINETIKNRKDAYAKELSSWIRQPSLAGAEKDIQNMITARLLSLGMQVDMWDMDGEELKQHPYFRSPRTEFINCPIVVGVWRGTKRSNAEAKVQAVEVSVNAEQIETKVNKTKEFHSVILNGHIDVVPVGDLQQWSRDPFSGEIDEQGNMHGRGTTDMKGGIYSSLIAIDVLKTLGVHLKGDVIFQSVAEEESGGSGTLATIMRGYAADAAIIPEPTNMKIFPKQQGSMWFQLDVAGLSAHGGTRYEGVSAIEKSMVVINALKRLEEKRNEPIKKDDPLFAKIPIPVPINVGTIEGGKWPSSVADLVTIKGRMGVIPQETMENAKKEMADALAALATEDSWFAEHPVNLTWFGAQWLPGSVDLDHPLMSMLTEAYKSSYDGAEPVIEASPWGTDGGLLTQLANTPSIVFGPGETALAHQRDESISLEKVYKCGEIIALTLLQWCGIDETRSISIDEKPPLARVLTEDELEDLREAQFQQTHA